MSLMHAAILMLNRGRGSGGVARQHARSLMDRGHTVTFMHPQMNEGVAGADNREIPLHSEVLPVHEFLPGTETAQRAVAHMAPVQAAAYTDDYERALYDATHDVDLIIAHHANITAVAAHRVATRRHIPYVLFVHGTGIEPYHRSGYAPQVWAQIAAAVENADGIIVTTGYVRDELILPVVRVRPERFLVLPCGVDLNEFSPRESNGVCQKYGLPERFAICPGAVTWLKGPQNVVAASRHYADLAPTVFIGDGDLRIKLEDSIGDRGRFLGFVSNADKAALIAAATVLVAAPEKKEHFGIIYAEALAAGTVPVAYEGGGVDTIVTSDVGVLTSRSPDELGRAVRRILTDDFRRIAMSAAGRRRAQAHFDDRQLAMRLLQWLEDRAVPTMRGPASSSTMATIGRAH